MVDIQFKYGANNVPRISDTEIERHAMLFIQDYNTDLLKIPQPLDVEDFAEGYLGLNFHTQFMRISRIIRILFC